MKSARFVLSGLVVGVAALSVAVLLAFSPISPFDHTSTAQAFTLSGPAYPAAGQTLTLNNEDVQIDFISQSAGFNNEFGRALPTPTQMYFMCHSAPSGIISGGRYAGPLELRFYLKTPAQGVPNVPQTFYTGPAANNPDNYAHARLSQINATTVRVEWEDLWNGGDQDFNDCIIDIIITPLASLTICKDVVGNDLGATSWNFSIDGPDALSDRTVTGLTDVGGCQAEATLSAGAYTISETTSLPGYTTSINCPGKGSSSSSSISISLSGGDDITCTVTNTTTAQFVVNKDFVPNNAQDVLVSLTCDSGTVAPDDPTASESDPANFTVTGFGPGATCDATEIVPAGYVGNDGPCQNVSISPNGNSSCTITNTANGQIIVRKETFPPTSPGSFIFTGDAAGTISHGQEIPVGNLPPGTYTSTENNPAPAYQLTSIVCDDGASATPSSGNVGTRTATFNVDPGETVKCTFTNTKQPTLTVNKVVNPASDTGQFNLQIDLTTQTACAGNDGTTGPVIVSIGSHTVGETACPPASLGNYVTTYSGDCNSLGSVILAAGENKTCTITNTRKGTISITKDSISNDAQDFSFSGTCFGAFSLDDGSDGTLSNTKTGSVAPGSCTVIEGPVAGWALTNLQCIDPDSGTGISVSTGTATIDIDPGEAVSCTFTNEMLGSVTVCKEIVPPDATVWDFQVYGPNSGTVTGLGDGQCGTVNDVLSGSYTVSETFQPNYRPSVDCGTKGAEDGNQHTFTLNPGEDVTCTFTNEFSPGPPVVGGIAGLLDVSRGPTPPSDAAGVSGSLYAMLAALAAAVVAGATVTARFAWSRRAR